jgi:hypothetical protein
MSLVMFLAASVGLTFKVTVGTRGARPTGANKLVENKK